MTIASDLLKSRSYFIKKTARNAGFDYCGIARARRLDEQEQNLREYLSENRHGQMAYMENHFEKRLDPRELVPGTKSVISLLYNYFPHEFFAADAEYKISRYALGKDYHFVVKEKMRQIVAAMQSEFGEFGFGVFTDSAPVMERAWAQQAGLGWQGKNTMLINLKHGTYFFLAEIFVDIELQYDQPMVKDFCGSCHRCLDACPTNALTAYNIDASKCISYLTIENRKEEIGEEFRGEYREWIFGCDICQEVCPWNKFSKVHDEPEFLPHPDLLNITTQQWEELTPEQYRKLFRKNPVKRIKFKGLKRNIDFLKDQNL